MTKYLYATLLLLIIFGSCKKESKPATFMIVVVNGDSSWTANSVNTYANGNGFVTLSATNLVTHARVQLAMYNFSDGRKTYGIDYQGVGGITNGNSGSYEWDNQVAVGYLGEIEVTKVNVKTFEGVFDFTGLAGRISGNFVAMKP